jgi:hypothetical protein
MNPRLWWTAVLLLSMRIGSAAPVEKWNSRVTVLVSGYDTSLIDIVSGCLTQHLRSVKDITVVDAEPGYYLRVMVIENKTVAKSVGYTLSVVVTHTVQDEYLRNSVHDEGRLAFRLRLYGNVENIADSWIVSAPHDELDQVCRKIVDTFYWGALEQARNSRRRLGEVVYGIGSPE